MRTTVVVPSSASSRASTTPSGRRTRTTRCTDAVSRRGPTVVDRMSAMDVPTAAGLALGAAADLALGDPRRGHPVAGFGTAAAALERRVWRDSRPTGAAYAVALTAAA